jgi:tyrosinase
MCARRVEMSSPARVSLDLILCCKLSLSIKCTALFNKDYSMLHHCNIDRLFAMWQAIYFDKAIPVFKGPGSAQFGTPAGEVTANSTLKPFVKADGSYHDSITVTKTWDLGYTYPGIRFWDRTEAQVSQDVTSDVARMYGPGSVSRVRRRAAVPSKHYFAQLKLDREKLPRPCEVQLFLGSKPVGSVAILGMPAAGIAHGEIPLSKAMLGSGIQAPEGDGAEEFFRNIVTARVIKVCHR